MAGRPTVFTDEAIQKLEDAFADGLSNREACFLAGVSESAFYVFTSENPELKERFELLQDSVKIHAKRNIARTVKSGDSNDSKWFLERRVKEFNPKQEIEANGNLTIKVVSYGDNNTPPIQSEELPVGIPESTPEIQDSGIS